MPVTRFSIFPAGLAGSRQSNLMFGGQTTPPRIIAHRGAQIERLPTGEYRIHVENTLDAFKTAAKMNLDGIELDVMALSTGEVVVHHDHFLDRVFKGEKAPIQTLSLKQVQQAVLDTDTVELTVSQRLPDKAQYRVVCNPDAEKIPQLSEVIRQVQALKPDMHFFIELKIHDKGKLPRREGLEEKVAELIRNDQLYSNVTVISFNPWSLKKIKALDPNIRTGLDMVQRTYRVFPVGWDKLFWMLKKGLGIDVVLPPYKEVTPFLMQAAERHGLQVMPWASDETVDEELQAYGKLSKLGVQGMVSNAPGLLLAQRQSGSL